MGAVEVCLKAYPDNESLGAQRDSFRTRQGSYQGRFVSGQDSYQGMAL